MYGHSYHEYAIKPTCILLEFRYSDSDAVQRIFYVCYHSRRFYIHHWYGYMFTDTKSY